MMFKCFEVLFCVPQIVLLMILWNMSQYCDFLFLAPFATLLDFWKDLSVLNVQQYPNKLKFKAKSWIDCVETQRKGIKKQKLSLHTLNKSKEENKLQQLNKIQNRALGKFRLKIRKCWDSFIVWHSFSVELKIHFKHFVFSSIQRKRQTKKEIL
jgi:hypothetical protein